MKNGLNMINVWISALMVLIVIAGAFVFTFTDFMSDRLYGSKRVTLSVVFLAYALFRGFRIYQILKSKKDE